jgi:GDP-4-dehydro-6-deoxy-D-mannose reductase
MIKILVTGINGFVGKHLARELHDRGCEVVGVGRDNKPDKSIKDAVDNYIKCDLTDKNQVAKLPLENIATVINLAGLANVGASFGQEELYNRINVGVLNLIGERVLELGLKTRIISVSTGAVYSSAQMLPLSETSTLITQGSPYALSKVAMETEASRLRSAGLNCIIARPFNHIGPGQEAGFLIPDLYQKIIAAIAGDGVVKVGNLATKRDYTDVRDVANAYADLALAEALDDTKYNICSGKSVAGIEIFKILTDNIPGSEHIKTMRDESLIRLGDPVDLYGDNSRIEEETGWSPIIPIEQTIADFVASKS